MSRRAGLLFAMLGFAGLFGFDKGGCGGPSPVPPVSTTGGTSGGSVDGGKCLPACGQLNEAECGTRSECHAIYVEDGCTQRFDHCEANACPVFNWMAPKGCVPKHDANGCLIPECESQSCNADSDCGPGFECEGLGACPPGVPTCDKIHPGTMPPCCAPSAGVCVATKPPPGCTNDSQCAPGQICEGACACPPGAACLCPANAGQCVDVADGGPWSGDGGWGVADGGIWWLDGGQGEGDGGSRSTDGGLNCGGVLECNAGDVCVHWQGGAMQWDGGSPGWYQCQPVPAACANGSCDCIGTTLCNGKTVCSANQIDVECYAP